MAVRHPYTDTVTERKIARVSAMKKNGIVTFIVGMALIVAQSSLAGDLMPSSELDVESSGVASRQVATIYQAGQGNEATILQQGSHNGSHIMQQGFANVASTRQAGHANEARVVQSGAHLEASILQNGLGHDAGIVQVGYGKEATIHQHGAYGTAEIHQLGTHRTSPITITQFSRGQAAVQVYRY